MHPRPSPLWLPLLLLLACSTSLPGPQGEPGPQGPQGPPGPQGPAAETDSFRCTPEATSCDGSRRSRCTRSGRDAVTLETCAGGSDTNPVSCHTDRCRPGDTACCRSLKPTCQWNLSAPAAQGESYTGVGSSDGSTCIAPSACSRFAVDLRLANATCDRDSKQLQLSVSRPVYAGEVLILPDPRASILLLGTEPCYSWRGTLSVVRDTPHWALTVDVTCADSGVDAAIRGDFSGEL